MDRTRIQDEKLYFGSLELSNLLIRLVRGYQFMNNNKIPKAVFLPRITSIKVGEEVIPIEYEQSEQPASPVKPKRSKAGASDSPKAV